jgi:hypothetical protein
MGHNGYASSAANSTSVPLSKGDMDLLRSSVMHLSQSLQLHGEQQHAPTNRTADAVALIPSHPIQSVARPASSLSADSDIVEDINPTTPVTLQPTVSQASGCRVSRPLSSRAMHTTVGSTLIAPSCSADISQAADCGDAKASSHNSSTSATQVVNQLGRGPGIMQQLRARMQVLHGAQAATLGTILEALEHAEDQGLDITMFLVDVLNRDAHDSTAAQHSCTSGRVPLWMPGPKPKGAMRLPRGLESRGLSAKQMSPVCKGEWRLRILASYDDAPIVGLSGIEALSKDGTRCNIFLPTIISCNSMQYPHAMVSWKTCTLPLEQVLEGKDVQSHHMHTIDCLSSVHELCPVFASNANMLAICYLQFMLLSKLMVCVCTEYH